MRTKFLLLFSLFVLAAFTPTTTIEAQSIYSTIYIPGTAVGDTITNLDTNYYYINSKTLGVNLRRCSLFLIVKVRQLSGTASGSIDLQVAMPPDRTNDNIATWVTTSTQALTAGNVVIYQFSKDLFERRVRLRVATPAGTRSLAVSVEGGRRTTD